ncbi:MAG TPA: nuclear transport factor 2 family protein, partial [Acidimicrobiia bacterium]|nr:nuclear transport factor 2 family protein [Acidimicrobiia bacterium]
MKTYGGNEERAHRAAFASLKHSFEKVGAYFAPDGEYTDMPTPAEDVARGPAQIAARLRLGLDPLSAISHDVRAIVCDGDTVVTEHVEHWEWPTGERASLPFVSVQQIR